MKIEENDLRELLIYAFRYTLGRMSYAPHTVIKIITENWNVLKDNDKKLLKREIQEAIDADRAGANCDVNGWKKVLELN